MFNYILKLHRKNNYKSKIIVVFVVTIFLWLTYHISYINLLFPLWLDIYIFIMTLFLLFKKIMENFEYTGLFLWIIVISMTFLKQMVLAEQLSISLYFIIATIVVIKTKFFLNNKNDK